MAKRRPVLEKEAPLDELFSPRRQRGKKTRRLSPSQKKFPHSTYRLHPGQHDRLKEIAEEEGVDLNELVRFILAEFIEKYENGQIELPREVEKREVEEVKLVYQW